MKSSKSSLITFLGVFTFGVILVWGTRGQVQDKRGEQKDATPVIEGVMTAKQIEHSKLYTQSSQRKKLATYESDATIIIGLPWLDETMKGQATFEEYLLEMTCEADAVILGLVENKVSQLTTEGTFIFTDYEITVGEVLKDNLAAPIAPHSQITVTRPGGSILLNGKFISVRDKSFRQLEPRRSYLLFLKYVPSTSAYKSFSSESGFEVDKNQLSRLTEREPSYPRSGQKDRFTTISDITGLKNKCGDKGAVR